MFVFETPKASPEKIFSSSPLKWGFKRREGERTSTLSEWDSEGRRENHSACCAREGVELKAWSLMFDWLAQRRLWSWSWLNRSAAGGGKRVKSEGYERTAQALSFPVALLRNLHTVEISGAGAFFSGAAAISGGPRYTKTVKHYRGRQICSFIDHREERQQRVLLRSLCFLSRTLHLQPSFWRRCQSCQQRGEGI